SYQTGGPTYYGTVLEIYGRPGHQTTQLNFGGWDNSKIRYREAFYADTAWSSWITLLDSKNNIESAGNLMVSGGGNHYIQNGNFGIGATSPDAKLHIAASTGTLLKAVGSNGYLLIDNVGSGENYYSANSNHHFQTGGTDKMVITTSGSIGIGTPSPDEKLTVNGKIHAKEIRVDATGLPDYVFEADYQLPSLRETEAFIKKNKHLPEVPSAASVEKNGLELGEMNKILLKKIEELTLHLIEKEKTIERQEMRLKAIEEKLKLKE
ncbi:MAG: tail fiber protein, partial [Cellulomonas sp.]|nr:tail fiber protein [Cellulomonas sp.]